MPNNAGIRDQKKRTFETKQMMLWKTVKMLYVAHHLQRNNINYIYDVMEHIMCITRMMLHTYTQFLS